MSNNFPRFHVARVRATLPGSPLNWRLDVNYEVLHLCNDVNAALVPALGRGPSRYDLPGQTWLWYPALHASQFTTERRKPR